MFLYRWGQYIYRTPHATVQHWRRLTCRLPAIHHFSNIRTCGLPAVKCQGSFTLSATKQHDLTVEKIMAISITFNAITPEKSNKRYSAHTRLREKSQLTGIQNWPKLSVVWRRHKKWGGGGELIAQRKALLCLLSFLFIRHRLQRSHKYDAHYSLVRMDLKMIAQRKALLCLLSFLFIKHRLQRSHKYDNHDSLVRMDLKLYG